jgi:predicted nucleic acid-binding protein
MEPAEVMIVHLDTSVLVDALTGRRRALPALKRAVTEGHVLAWSSLVLYEWLRGPRVAAELEDQAALLPATEARSFGPVEAARAAHVYPELKRARGRDMDIAIAACALEHGAHLWTLNPDDFRDIPALRLYEPG